MTREFTIQELTQLSGVPRRNIYFYTQQGILPPPQGAGLSARYSDVHLERLRAIPVLRSQGLRLDQIRERLQGMDAQDVRDLTEHPLRSMKQMQAALPTIDHRPAGTAYIHYALPAGVTLIAPAGLSVDDRHKVNQLIETAARLWNQPAPIPKVETDHSTNDAENDAPGDGPDDERN